MRRSEGAASESARSNHPACVRVQPSFDISVTHPIIVNSRKQAAKTSSFFITGIPIPRVTGCATDTVAAIGRGNAASRSFTANLCVYTHEVQQ